MGNERERWRAGRRDGFDEDLRHDGHFRREAPRHDRPGGRNAAAELYGGGEEGRSSGIPGTDNYAARVYSGDESALADRAVQTFGEVARGIAVRDDAGQARGAEAAAVSGEVFVARRGDADESVRVGHEIAHAIQQRRGDAGAHAPMTRGRRSALEAEAEIAGHAFAAGLSFRIEGRAPAGVALFRGAADALDSDALDSDALDSAATLEADTPPSGLPSGPALEGAHLADGAVARGDHDARSPRHDDVAHGSAVHNHEAHGAKGHGDSHHRGSAHSDAAASTGGAAARGAAAAGSHAPGHDEYGGKDVHAAKDPHVAKNAPVHGPVAHSPASASPFGPAQYESHAPAAAPSVSGSTTMPTPHATTKPQPTAPKARGTPGPDTDRSHAVPPRPPSVPVGTKPPGPENAVAAVPAVAAQRPSAQTTPPNHAAGNAVTLRGAIRPKAPPARLPSHAHARIARPAPPPVPAMPRAATMMPAIPAAGPPTASPLIADAVARLRTSLAETMGITASPVRFTEPSPPVVAPHAADARFAAGESPGSDFAPELGETSGSPGAAPDPGAVAARAARRRAQAQQLVAELMRRGTQRVHGVIGLGATVARRVHPALEAAHATITERVAHSERIIRSAVTTARTRVSGTHTQTRGAITSGHQQTTAAVRAATTTARAAATAGHTAALAATASHEQQQIGHIQQIYNQYDPRYREVGPRVGDAAASHAAERAANWRSQFDGQSDFWDGPIHDNRLRARADAAISVGDAYRSGLADEGNKQADQARAGQSKDIDNVHAVGIQIREQLGHTQTQTHAALTTAEHQALEAAQHTVDGILATLEQQADGALHSLVEQQTSLLHGVQQTGHMQRRAIDDAGRGAVASLQHSLATATGGLRQTLASLHAQLDGHPAPDPTALAGALRQVNHQLDASAIQAVAGAERGATSAIQGAAAHSAQVAQGLTEAGQFGAEAATGVGAGFAQNAAHTHASAQTAFGQLSSGHQATSAQASTTATQAFIQQVAGMATMFEQLEQSLRGGFDQSLRGLQDGLRGALGRLDPDINRETDKAAAQVQPRWKSVLKVVLAIAIVLVVAIVVGPAVVGFVGAAAGVLGASAGAASVIGAVVGGAIVGAGAGAVNQMGNNLIDGQPVMNGVGHAAIMGAVTGAIGGGAGAWGSALSRGGSTLAGLAVRVGGNMVGAFGAQVVADVATGHQIDWRAAATGAAVAGVFSLGAEGLGAFARAGAAGRFGRLGAFAGRVGDTVGRWQLRAGAYGARAGGFVGSRIQMGIDSVRGVLGYEGTSSSNRLGPQPGSVDLSDPHGREHILEGEGAPGDGRGRHAYGGGEPSSYRADGRFRPKSEFPPDWSNERILTNASDVATDPQAYASPNNPNNPASTANRVFYGIRDGVLMQVVVEPNGRIVTAYPVNQATVRVPGGPPGTTMVVNSPTPVRANPALPDHPILPPPTQGGDEHRDSETP